MQNNPASIWSLLFDMGKTILFVLLAFALIIGMPTYVFEAIEATLQSASYLLIWFLVIAYYLISLIILYKIKPSKLRWLPQYLFANFLMFQYSLLNGIKYLEIYSLLSLTCVEGSLVIGLCYLHYTDRLKPLLQALIKPEPPKYPLQLQAFNILNYFLMGGLLILLVLSYLTHQSIRQNFIIALCHILFLQSFFLLPLRQSLERKEFIHTIENLSFEIKKKDLCIKFIQFVFKVGLILSLCHIVFIQFYNLNWEDLIDIPSVLFIGTALCLTFVIYSLKELIKISFLPHSKQTTFIKLKVLNQLKVYLIYGANLSFFMGVLQFVNSATSDLSAIFSVVIASINYIYLLILMVCFIIPLELHLKVHSIVDRPMRIAPIPWYRSYASTLVFIGIVLISIFLVFPYMEEAHEVPVSKAPKCQVIFS